MIADLHCHTTCSDGAVSVEDVVELSEKRHVSLLSVTDHDTFAGTDAASVLARDLPIRIVTGAEISCWDHLRRRKVHLLCYAPADRTQLQLHFDEMCGRRAEAGLKMLKKVSGVFPIDTDRVLQKASAAGCVYKQHIMDVLVEQGFAREIYGKTFDRLFKPEVGECFVPIYYPDIHDAIKLVHRSGGIAIMAHPGNYNGMDLMRQLTEDREVDGVEWIHPKNTPVMRLEIYERCRAQGLLMTGGSDYHGRYSKRFQLPGDCAVNGFEIERFLTAVDKR